jgi:hypothetical protein
MISQVALTFLGKFFVVKRFMYKFLFMKEGHPGHELEGVPEP